ncbi:unnamed protein product, partial [Cylicostephanus goldi]
MKEAGSTNDIVAHFYKKGLATRRKSIERAKASHATPALTWNSIPERYALNNSSSFLQESTQTYQIYFSCETLKMACQQGLKALIMDGLHKVLPTELGDHAQLYTIHGSLSNEHQVPLFHILMRNMAQHTYEKFFERVWHELNSIE